MTTSAHLVFAIDRYEYLRDAFCLHPGFEAGELKRVRFADGERGLTVGGDPRGRDAIIIGGTVDDTATLELFDLACGLVGREVSTLSMVLPYFGYSTQERASHHGEVVTAKARALLLSAVPRARLTNELVTIDLHTPGIQHYFEGHLHSIQLTAKPLVLDVVRKIAAKGETVVACTDAGRAKQVQEIANDCGLTASFVYKARQQGGSMTVTGVNADVKGKQVIVYDDIVRTGGSLLQAAKAYKDAGAAAITAITTHGVLPGDSLKKLQASGLLEALYCTDTVPHARHLAEGTAQFLRILPISGPLVRYFSAKV